MLSLYLGALGLVLFVGGTVVCRQRIRRQPTKAMAESTSRLMHALFFAGLGLPFMVSLVYPGLGHLDALVGLRPLPARSLCIALGVLLCLPGLYFLGGSNRSLRALGSGANAFRLTQKVVIADVYRLTRNPMSLGYYLCCIGIALISGSTLLTAYVLLGLVPAHLFFLKFFEEHELELRLGASYRQYRETVPFLLPLPRSPREDVNA